MTDPTHTAATPGGATGQSYPSAEWRLLLETEPRTGAWNMALDEAIMDSVAEGSAPPTLRFYQWAPPCLSLGRRQPLQGVDLELLRADGCEAVRRATGGWAILHTDELTYSVALKPEDPRADGPILDAYRKLSAGLVAGLELLDVAAIMKPASAGGTHNLTAACFEVPSAYEITAQGRKLIGSAQARPNGRVLQHGSLPLVGDIARVTRYLTFTDDAERQALASHLRERAATLSAVAGREIPFAEAAGAMREGFARALNVTLTASAPTPDELRRAEALMAEKQAEMV
ncbi:MAG TPA: lipoate--protein ligase family protein [Ktedonobacterales bacterium]|nr:lipoate--protein ligase family protein [Ktedonobacterales bacterium]